MATATTGHPGMVHRGRDPGSTHLVAAAAGIAGHRRDLVRLGAAYRPTGCSRAVVAGRAIVGSGDPGMVESGGLPRGNAVAADALRITGGRDMTGRLAACVAAVVAARAVLTLAAGDPGLAVVKRGRHPPCRRVAIVAAGGPYGDMFGRHPFGSNAVVAVSTFLGANLSRGMRERCRNPGRLDMANAALFCRTDVQGRLSCGSRAVMTGLAIRIPRTMGECGR